MPIEIHTLVVKAVYNEPAQGQTSSSTSSKEHQAQDQQAVIEACVEQVLEILERKQRR